MVVRLPPPLRHARTPRPEAVRPPHLRTRRANFGAAQGIPGVVANQIGSASPIVAEEAPPVPPTLISQSNALPLEEFVARVQRHPGIAGIVLVGSGSRQEVTAGSDYDLVIVADFPVPLGRVHTYVAGRLTEITDRDARGGGHDTAARAAERLRRRRDQQPRAGGPDRVAASLADPGGPGALGPPAGGRAAGAWQILLIGAAG